MKLYLFANVIQEFIENTLIQEPNKKNGYFEIE